MGEHVKDETEAVKASEGKKKASLSDLARELKKVGEQLGVEFAGIEVVSSADADLWGETEHIKHPKGTIVEETREPIPHMAQIAADAADAASVVELRLNNGDVLFGRVLSVSPSLLCLEVWEHEAHGDHLSINCMSFKPKQPAQAYIDIRAIDAFIRLPGDYAKGEEKADA